MKKAFTLLELVFVIAILGIFASIAISKIAKNRNDADISIIINQIAQARAGLMAYANKQILAGKSETSYPNPLEKTTGKARDNKNVVLFDNILPNSTLKSNAQDFTSSVKKNGWSTKTGLYYKTRYYIFVGGNIITMVYCDHEAAVKEKELSCKGRYGQLICISDKEKCKIIGEQSYQ